ncbi:MAG TPA: DUF222 domain-containing protein [Microbacterium sp.]|nr:DUF222 domain-containing protein [Microbacterium sp.]
MGRQVDSDDAAWSALDRVVADMQSTRSEIARLQAEELRLLTDAADIVRAREQARRATGRKSPHDLPLREVSAELGAAMRLSDRTVQARMSAASTLCDGFGATFTALGAGRIDLAHASAIVDAGAVIADPEMREQYERIVLEAAEFETPHRLRAIARVVAARIDPDLAEELRRRAVGRRHIRVIDLDDGMARLLADLPAVLAHAIYDRLTQMAEAERAAEREEAAAEAPPAEGDARPAEGGDDDGTERGAQAAPQLTTGPQADVRSLDELRADIFADLVLTGAPTGHGEGDALAAIRAEVQITVPVLTAAGTGNEPALLAGYGPIDADTARELAAAVAGWDRVMYHPHSGIPLAVDRYRSSAGLKRFLRARDERCRFPGCRRRPSKSDIDHTVDRALGGETADDNLAHLCRRHHTLKHATAWRVRQLGDGILEWISPTQRRYLDKPLATVQFVPSTIFDRYLAVPYDSQAPF